MSHAVSIRTEPLAVVESSSESRLSLLEQLSEADDPRACARVAVAWLGIPGSCVVVLESDGARFAVLASSGCGALGDAIADPDGALRAALNRASLEPPFTSVAGASLGAACAPLGALALVPLLESERVPGALLIPYDACAARTRPIAWLARHLARRLDRALPAEAAGAVDLVASVQGSTPAPSGVDHAPAEPGTCRRSAFGSLMRVPEPERSGTALACAREAAGPDRAIRAAEAAARGERDRLDLIIDSVADPILVSDAQGAISMMNAPAERLFAAPVGTPRELRRRVRANIAQFTSFVSAVSRASADLRWKGDVCLVDPATGEKMPAEAISGKTGGGAGVVTDVVTILHDRREALENARLYARLKDASEQLELKVHQATEELVRQNELLRRQAMELEQASQLKSQFLANMSHEFRTPLNAILGYTSMLLEGLHGELTASQRKSLSRVASNGRHLLSIINDILDISRIEAGRMPLRLGDVHLPDLVREVIAELEPVIASHPNVRLSTSVPSTACVRTDRAKVKQIVMNLVTNALKFTPKGAVRIVVRRDVGARSVSIAVTDTGIGIAEDNQTLVFEDFRQVDDSPTREYGGTGVGLSLCRRLAKMLGGTITLRSAVGRGSRFTLTLPRRPRRRRRRARRAARRR